MAYEWKTFKGRPIFGKIETDEHGRPESQLVTAGQSLEDSLNEAEAGGWSIFAIDNGVVVARKEIIPRTCDNCVNLVPDGPLFFKKCSEGFESVKVGANRVDCEKYVASE